MGQPARDPNDPRYIPARLGGTGAGFTKARDKQASPHYLGAISPEGSLTDRPASRIAHVDRTEDSKVVSKGLIRARARLVAIKSLDALADRVPSMDNGELVSAANVAGKLAGMTQAVANHIDARSITVKVERSRAQPIDGGDAYGSIGGTDRAAYYIEGGADATPPTEDAEIVPEQGETEAI